MSQSHPIYLKDSAFWASEKARNGLLKTLSSMPVSNPTELKAFGEAWIKAFNQAACSGFFYDSSDGSYDKVGVNAEYYERFAAQGKDGVLSAMDDMIKEAEGSFPYVLDTSKKEILKAGEKIPWYTGSGEDSYDHDLHVAYYDNSTQPERQGQKELCEGLLKLLKKKRNEVRWNYQVPLLLRPKSLGILAVGGLIAWVSYGLYAKKSR